MPHQQNPRTHSQQHDPSAPSHQGSFYPFMQQHQQHQQQHPDHHPYNRGYGMITAPVQNPNHPMYYPQSMGEWNNKVANGHNNGATSSNSSGSGSRTASSPFPNHNNKKNDERDGEAANENTISHQKNSASNGSHESDEEAAVAALLMAGGTRSDGDNAETMKAEVRKQKQQTICNQYNNKNIGSDQISPSSKNSDDHITNGNGDGTGTLAQNERQSCLVRENVRAADNANTIDSNVIVKDFTSALHEVLTNSEYSGTVLEWLNHGKSWRILRWDELSNSVMPAYFPDLCAKSSSCDDTQSSATERMNMFIRQIKAWGFKEVKEVGPDLGSFHNEFFIKIAPNLCRYMKFVGKSSGTKRPAESNIISPPRRGPKGRFSMQSAPALNPGFHVTPEGPKAHERVSSTIESPKMKLFVEKREEVNVYASSPGSQSGPRSVTFLERSDADGSPIHPSHKRPPFESPRSSVDMYSAVNYVSPSSVKGNDSHKASPWSRLRSNRGGSRAPSRYVELDERSISSLSAPRGSFPVSNRGRGTRNVSTRGRSPKMGNVMMRAEKIEDSPMLLMKIEKRQNAQPSSTVSSTAED